jgi:hypothetical protein
MELLQDLPPKPTPQQRAGVLGYRGFILSDIPGAPTGSRRIRVGDGSVTVESENDEVQHFVDKQGLEQRLLQLAARHGYRVDRS